MVDMVSPKEWGAQIDYDTWDYGPWAPDKWVVHYGGGANRAGDAEMAAAYGYSFPSVDAEKVVLRAWENWHVNGRGWKGIAYNYAIGQSGTIYRLRGENHAAATSGDYEPDGIPENTEARAVVFILGGTQIPTDEALAAFRRLYWDLDRDLPIIVHSDTKDTQCPGDFLRNWIHSGAWKGWYMLTDEEIQVLKDLVAAVISRDSNGGFAGYAIDLIRKERQMPLHDKESLDLAGKELVVKVEEVK